MNDKDTQDGGEHAPAKAGLLVEALDLSEARFDDSGVLRGVVLIRAGMSKNRRNYSESVLQKAASVFEGAKAYNDHARSHKATDITGWYSNVRYSEGKLVADRYFAPTQAGKDVQALAQEIVAGRAPADLAGLSINAAGKVKPHSYHDGDGFEVESISAAESVDDVASPAAGGSYLAASVDAMTSALLAEMGYEEFLEARPDFVERLRKDFKRVRQDEALKSVREQEQRALTETRRATEALEAAQQTLGERTSERDQAFIERDGAQRALAVERVVNDPEAQLPPDWKTSLREDLQQANPDDWGAILERTRKLAASAGYRPRVTVSGIEQQINEAAPLQNTSPLPQPTETMNAWLTRMARTKV